MNLKFKQGNPCIKKNRKVFWDYFAFQVHTWNIFGLYVYNNRKNCGLLAKIFGLE